MLVIIIHTSGIYVEYNRSIYLIIFVISQTYRTYPHSFPHMLVTFLHKWDKVYHYPIIFIHSKWYNYQAYTMWGPVISW